MGNNNINTFIRLRFWDDKAKEVNKPTQSIPNLKVIALNHLLENA